MFYRTWCVDTGATDHVCNYMQGFQQSRMLRDGEMYVFMGDATKVAVVAVGVITLYFGIDRILVLNNCLYVPSFRRNLISVSKLAMDGYNVCLDRSTELQENKVLPLMLLISPVQLRTVVTFAYCVRFRCIIPFRKGISIFYTIEK
ncbi:hypothetical protein ACR2XN_28180 [Klebsiella pneumoniae]